jgi:hypothetical protein
VQSVGDTLVLCAGLTRFGRRGEAAWCSQEDTGGTRAAFRAGGRQFAFRHRSQLCKRPALLAHIFVRRHRPPASGPNTSSADQSVAIVGTIPIDSPAVNVNRSRGSAFSFARGRGRYPVRRHHARVYPARHMRKLNPATLRSSSQRRGPPKRPGRQYRLILTAPERKPPVSGRGLSAASPAALGYLGGPRKHSMSQRWVSSKGR